MSTEQTQPPEELMEAVYESLVRYGYADLSTQKIADEWGKSQSLVHYYCDTKRDLLAAFLEWLADQEDRWRAEHLSEGDVGETLATLLEAYLEVPRDEEQRDFHVALYELQVEARREPAYREPIQRFDERTREAVVAVIEEGIERGVFREVDADAWASFLLTTVLGSVFQKATLGEEAAHAREVRRVLLEEVVPLLEAEGDGP
jgi:AcrR family transcriptional regulator